MVNGTAWFHDTYITKVGERMTQIQARSLSGGGATGTVRIATYINNKPVDVKAVGLVRDLAVEAGFAYLFIECTAPPMPYAYMVVYDGSSYGGVDYVSYAEIDYEEVIRAYFDARAEGLLMPVFRGSYRFVQ